MAVYTPAMLGQAELNRQHIERDDLVAVYYYMGYTVDEIVGFLALRHFTAISKRQVHRILRNYNLRRRQHESNLEDIVRAVIIELSGNGADLGYRSMRQRLMLYHNLVVSHETVRHTLSVIDGEGVLRRSRRTLTRRTYINKGPNFAHHLDGWDKLKPYGISVHGCVDGFSRRVLWLEACISNKNPLYIAHFYLRYVETIRGVPVILRGDRGTENAIVRDMQYALRWNHQDPLQGLSSFIYGSSTSNTRIERFWGILRRMCGNTWINFFKDLSEIGVLDTSDLFHLECVRYCFLPLIQQDLTKVMEQWNMHRMRRQRYAVTPVGVPDVLYFQPEIYNYRDYKLPLGENIEQIKQQYTQMPPVHGTSAEFLIIANEVIQQRNLNYPPTSRNLALQLFCEIIMFIEHL